MPSTDLIFRFIGVDAGAGREFDRMAGKAGGTAGALGKLSLGVAATGVTFAVESIRMASKFQTSMELIHTQAGASQAEVNKLSKAVLSLAGPTATAPETLSEGLYHLESAGFRGAKAMQALQTAAEGAKLGGANLEDVTNALNATLVSGIKGAQDMQGAMGALNATVGAGDMRMQDLAEAMGTGVLAAVKGFGLSLNDVGAALATFGDNNIRGADAATQLRMAVLFMAKPAASAKKALGDIGLTTKQLAKDMGRGGLGLALQDLHDHLVKAGDTGSKMGQVLLDAFGKKAGTGLSILEQQFGRFKTKQDEVAHGSKNFASAWGAYTKTFGYSWDSAKSAFEAMTIQIGTKLLPIATKAMKWIGTTGVADLDKFGGWVSRNKGPIEAIAKALVAVAAVKFVAGKISDLSRLARTVAGVATGKGAGGEIASLGKPLPVFVTNMGKGGLGLPGKAGGAASAERDAKTAAEGGAATKIAAKVVEKLGLTGAKRLGGPLALTYMVLKADTADGTGNLFAAGLNGSPQSKGGKASMSVAATLKKILGAQANSFIKDDGAIKILQTEAAVTSLLATGTAKQVAQVKALAKTYPAVSKVVAGVSQAHSVLNHYLAVNTGLAKANAAAHVHGANAEDRSLEQQAATAHDVAAKQKTAADSVAAAHTAAVNKILAQLRRISPGYAKLAAEATAGGNLIGVNLAQGLVNGMNAREQAVMHKAAELGAISYQTVAKVVGMNSPAKKTIYIGKMIAEGLIVGFQGVRTKMLHTLPATVQDMLARMRAGVTTELAALKSKVTATAAQLKSDLSNRSQFAQGLKDNLLGSSDISNAFDSNGQLQAFGFTRMLQGNVSTLKKLAVDVGKLRHQHLSNAVLQQIEGLPPDQALQAAESFLSGSQGAISYINSLEGQAGHYAGKAASTVAEAVWAKAIAKDRKAEAAALKEQKKQTKLLERIAEKVGAKPTAAEITKELKAYKRATGHSLGLA